MTADGGPVTGDVRSFLVRDARAEELGAVSGLMRAAYAPYFEDVPADRRETIDGYLRDIGDVWSRLADAELIVAEDDGRVVGAVTLFPDGSRAESGGWPRGWSGIRLLAVVPEARGRGIGRALTEECLRRARALGASAVALHTTDFMAVAKGMYERMGFARVPEYDFHPDSGTHVIAYRLPLQPG
ncbi:MAG: GNAT family N-acetyltransferase [Actinomycetota bacterium]